MGSGRGDRNQLDDITGYRLGGDALQWGPVVVTGISSRLFVSRSLILLLQWGPVVVTGISGTGTAVTVKGTYPLQWGPVVVTGISWTTYMGNDCTSSVFASMGSGRGDRNQVLAELPFTDLTWLQWGPVVVTGISTSSGVERAPVSRFNGVRSW